MTREFKSYFKNVFGGKPYVEHEDICFNLSHSEEMAMCAISSDEVGCDVEKITDIDLRIAERFFYTTEYAAIASSKSMSEQRNTFFRFWTLKESFLKATGPEMRLPLDSFRIVFLYYAEKLYREIYIITEKRRTETMKMLVVVDMQNDFITGALGSREAEAIVPRVVSLVEKFSGRVVFTRDTHGADYLATQEGEKLPVAHCIKGTVGWQICDALKPYAKEVIDKITFGSIHLPDVIEEGTDEIVLCGLCTDICVISNAMLLKAHYPELKITVDASCCAGVTPESHKTALAAMKCVQIEIVNEGLKP